MRVIKTSPIVDRLAETLDDYVAANPTPVQEVLDALKYVHAALERYSPDASPANKLH